jgi:hypothetical protein
VRPNISTLFARNATFPEIAHMFEIAWIYTGPERWHYVVGDYIFKKRELNGKTTYEIWKHDRLEENNLIYWEFMGKVKDILNQEQQMKYNKLG